jgi:hypothetical protein
VLLRSLSLALNIIGFGNVDCYPAIVVTRQDARGVAARSVRKKFKSQPRIRRGKLLLQRQAQRQQAVHHATFGELESKPGGAIVGNRQIRDNPGQPA